MMSFTTRTLAPVLAGLCASLTHAQPCSLLGEFQPFSPHYHTPAGALGYLVQSNILYVDTNRNGLVGPSDAGDKSFPMPLELRSPNPAPLNMRLSPTQDYLFSAGGALGSCSSAGTHVRIYSIPALSGQPLALLFDDCLPCTPNDGGAPLWYDEGITQGGFSGLPPTANPAPISTIRLAYIRTNTSPAGCGTGQPQLRFYDLNTLESATYELGLQPGAGVSHISPGGEYMIFQHDLTNNPADSDILVLNLCDITPLNTIGGSPPVLDNVNIVGIHAQVASSNAGTATINILDGSSQVRWTGQPPCCHASQAPLGSCCVNNHCSVTAQADCGGVWVSGGSCINTTCVPTNPDPIPAINAPTTCTVGQTISVPVTITNMGQAAAANVVVALTWTYGPQFTFVSATDGGAPVGGNPASTQWTIPSIAGGASASRSVTLAAGCYTGQHTFTCTVTATGIASRNSNQMVQVNPRPSTPITVSLASVPSATPPLLPGDQVTHTITLTNAGALPTPAFNLIAPSSGIIAGQSAVFDSIISCDGGTLCELVNQNNLFHWTGSLPPGQVRHVVVTTRIIDCIDPNSLLTSLGQGQPIFALDSCGIVLGVSDQPSSIAIAPALQAVLAATNIQAGIIGTPSTPAPGGMTIQPVRGTPNLALRATFTNRLASTLDLGAISITLPSGWTITAQPTNGAAYDAGTRMITFTAMLAAHASASFDVGVQPSVIDASHSTLTINRQTPTCGRSVGGLMLFGAPALPSGPFVLSANQFFGAPITIIARGVDTAPRDFLTGGGSWTGIAASDVGDLWFIGSPLTILNPDTLYFSQFAEANAFALALPQPSALIDGAVQPTTGDVILYARASDSAAAADTLLRFDPVSRVTSVIADVPRSFDAQRLGEVSIDSGGDILYCNHNQLLRYPGARGPQLPPNSGVALAVPGPIYTDPNYGTLLAQRTWTFAPLCDGSLAILHATEFDHPVGVPNATQARVFALSVFDSTSGTIRVIDPLFAGEVGYGGGSWSNGGSLAPTFQISHPYPFEAGGISMVQGEPGEIITGNDAYPAFHTAAIDLTSGAVTFLQDPHQFGFHSALDIVYRRPNSTICSTTPVCIGDYNQDGGIDGSDIGAFFTDWEAGNSAADVNADGGIDGADVSTFFQHWEAGC